jgi:hypothetical protein
VVADKSFDEAVAAAAAVEPCDGVAWKGRCPPGPDTVADTFVEVLLTPTLEKEINIFFMLRNKQNYL